ncbi:4-hydroxy-tetrahydrodipicolinate reductase [Streptococcus pasteurianus]|nr:4-hydroxy-tetrahydrodipicolinate reductase [Streptococcus pasteurianus]
MSIKVIIAGFKGRMGSAAVNMVKGDDELTLAALLDPFATESDVDGVPVFTDKSQLVGFDADVWVDFTMPAVAYKLPALLWKASSLTLLERQDFQKMKSLN